MGLKFWIVGAGAVVLIALVSSAAVSVFRWKSQAETIPGLKQQISALEIERDVLRGEVDSYSTELQKLNEIFNLLQQKHVVAVIREQELREKTAEISKRYNDLLKIVRETPPPPSASAETALAWLRANLPEGWVQ